MGVPVLPADLGTSYKPFARSKVELLRDFHPLDLFGIGLFRLRDQFQQKFVLLPGPSGKVDGFFLQSLELKLAEFRRLPHETLGQPAPLLFLLYRWQDYEGEGVLLNSIAVGEGKPNKYFELVLVPLSHLVVLVDVELVDYDAVDVFEPQGRDLLEAKIF